ncbi:MAG: peptidoglycan DD-metalloendopeptidase family protein [Oscillospiraceae bacterium]|nr:peptidoglycan DD-metalloendopeptidase family protein [Oscillospiraceae bacterium]
MKKKTIRIIAIILALILAGSVLVGALTSIARAVSQSEIDDLKSQKKDIEQKSQEIESKIDSLEYQQMNTIAKKQVLDEQISITQDLITNLEEQIEIYNGLIAEKEREVIAAQKREDDQYAMYKDRVRAMEENGTISYFEIIFGAKSFSDLLSRIDLISEIMTYDEAVYDAYVEAKEETIAAKEELEEANELQKSAKAEQEEREAELQDQIDEANDLILRLQNNIDDYQEEFAQLQEEEEKLQKEIDSMVEEMKRQTLILQQQREQEQREREQQQQGGGVSGDGKAYGNFIWPSASSNHVTSLYGTRLHPIYHTYRTHNGVDIGASYGTNVLAADGGRVTTASYNSSYGNYIIINHGNGTSTLYAHMSKLLVSSGTQVSQGQVIGLVGSTGVSTGPHLHFEVYVNGSRTNPLNYFSSSQYYM